MQLLFLCLCWASAGFVFPGGMQAAEKVEDRDPFDNLLPRLVSPEATIRRDAVQTLKASLDSRSAARLLETLPGRASGVRRAVRETLASGGPWMPGILNALGRGGAVAGEARSILEAALRKRPGEDEPLRGMISIDFFEKDAGLVFSGPWPGPVPLDFVLQRINEAAGPACPFVLSPCLAGGGQSGLMLLREPLSGPAEMVLDLILMEQGLGIEMLETVVLVTRRGGSCDSLSPGEQKFDNRLLDEIMAIYAGSAQSGTRQAALNALAWLDPPGFFHGFLRDFRRDCGGGCLDYLLFGRASARFALALGLDNDSAGVAALIRAFSGEKDLHRREALRRTILLISGDLRRKALVEQCSDLWTARLLLGPIDPGNPAEAMAAAARIDDLLRGGDPDSQRSGLRAALRHLPENGEVEAAVCTFLQERPQLDGVNAVLADRCLRKMGARGDDSDLARLLRTMPLKRGLLEMAAVRGGKECLAAILALLREAGDESFFAVTAGCAIAERLGPLDPERVGMALDAMTEVNRAGFLLSTGATAFSLEETAAPLLRALRRGDVEADRAAAMLSFLPAGRIVSLLDPVLLALEEENGSAGTRLMTRRLRGTLIRCATSRAHGQSLSASRVRVDLGAASSGIGEDRLLDHALRIAEGDGKPGSLEITVPLF